MGAFDPQLYRILLAEEINFMFTKIEHSHFVTPRQRCLYLLVFFNNARWI